MDIRPYEVTDRDACVAICEGVGAARAEFEVFLDTVGEVPYFVMEHEGAVVGCGGFTVSGVVGMLQWGMVAPAFRKMGLGRFLLLYRMREIGMVGWVELVLARVPRGEEGFFRKQGFKVQGEGADWVELVKRLVVCA
jgi:N-acetylglutamate synthase-like GNAT family acetyltransferase